MPPEDSSKKSLLSIQKVSGSPILKPRPGGETQGFFHRFIEAEKKHGPMLFWATVVGVLTGLLGGGFRLVLEAISDGHLALLNWAKSLGVLAWTVPVLFSALMVYIALFLVRRFAPETGGSGIQEMEGALDGVREVRWKRVLPIKFISGLFSLGSGLVMGREGPTIQMGGSIGKMISDWTHVSKENCFTLIAAGCGAGLAAAFNAPLAGILFVIEEMRPQFKYNFLSVQSVLIACAVSDIMVRALTSQAPVIPMKEFADPHLFSLWAFVIFGGIFGVFGFVFNKLLLAVLGFFTRMKGRSYLLTGLYVGAIIGALTWFFPGTTGGGYVVIPQVLKGNFATTVLLFLFLARFGTTVFSYGSGAPGGIFAPMLALGTLFGVWFGQLVQWIRPELIEAPAVFAVAGMAALFSATVRAPLTGIALAIEMTGNYSQILPLILTCMSASVVAQLMGGRPIYTLLLQRTLDLARKAHQLVPKKTESPC